MLDLTQYQIHGITFPTLDLDQLQDHFPDQDLEISLNPLSVTIVTVWVIQQTIVFDIRIKIFHADNLIRVEEIITKILKDIPTIQITGQILDIGFPILLNVG